MVKYIKKKEGTFLKDEISMLGSLVKNLEVFMDGVGLTKTNEIIQIYHSRV